MSWIRAIALAGAALVLMIACSGGNFDPDRAIKNDLDRYVKQVSIAGDIEAEADAANKKAVEAPGANDATYAAALRETIIPGYKDFQREAKRVHPTTNEILGLHSILLKRIDHLVDGLVELERAARTGDAEGIKKANMLFEFGKVEYKRWSEQMQELGKKYSKK